jgi:hypothetical protein
MFNLPSVNLPEEIAFKEAYFNERKRQELQGVVCISPEEIHARMPSLSKVEFEKLFKHMIDAGFIWVAKGTIQERIVFWNA